MSDEVQPTFGPRVVDGINVIGWSDSSNRFDLFRECLSQPVVMELRTGTCPYCGMSSERK